MALTKVLEGGIADDAVGNTKLDLSEDYTFTGTIVGAGGSNVPYFYGKKASNQQTTRNTTTKITNFTTNELDTDSAFDGTTFTVPSGKAGRYFIHTNLVADFTGGTGSDGERAIAYIYKNGSTYSYNSHFLGSSYNMADHTNSVSVIADLSAGDTIEIYAYNKDGNADGHANITTNSYFFGYKLA